LNELLAEAEVKEVVEEEAAAIEEPQPTMEDMDELWPYAKRKGVPDGIVHQVLEDTGLNADETLARLRERYGE